MESKEMVLFSAKWCTYCQPVKRLIEENQLPVRVVDIDENFEEAQAAGIRGIPVIRLEDGTMMRESKDIIAMLKGKFNV